jgi:hypothetical protein
MDYPVNKRLTFLKVSCKVWLILWVICLPLIHIHPEADHAHGMPGHVHGGTFHTDLTKSPICAYEDHRHHHDSHSAGKLFGAPDSAAHPLHGIEHDTYSFSVLNSSIDPILEGTASSSISAAAITRKLETPGTFFVARIDLFSPETRLLVLAYILSPRAPPFLSV